MRWWVTIFLILVLIIVLGAVVTLGHLTSWKYRRPPSLDTLFDKVGTSEDERDDDEAAPDVRVRRGWEEMREGRKTKKR